MLNMLSRFVPWVNHLTSNWLTSCTKKIAKSQGKEQEMNDYKKVVHLIDNSLLGD